VAASNPRGGADPTRNQLSGAVGGRASGALISIDKASLRAVFRGGSVVDGCGTAGQSVPRRCLRLSAAGGLLLAGMAKDSSRHTPRAYALARREAHATRRGYSRSVRPQQLMWRSPAHSTSPDALSFSDFSALVEAHLPDTRRRISGSRPNVSVAILFFHPPAPSLLCARFGFAFACSRRSTYGAWSVRWSFPFELGLQYSIRSDRSTLHLTPLIHSHCAFTFTEQAVNILIRICALCSMSP